jgi:hypothetical protein
MWQKEQEVSVIDYKSAILWLLVLHASYLASFLPTAGRCKRQPQTYHHAPWRVFLAALSSLVSPLKGVCLLVVAEVMATVAPQIYFAALKQALPCATA